MEDGEVPAVVLPDSAESSPDGLAGASVFKAGFSSGESSPEPGGKEAGLSVEVGDGAVIPDYVVGLLNFGAEVHLSGNDLFRDRFRETALTHHSVHLCRSGCGDNDDTIKLGLDTGFIK